jgi:hypothetical protein
MNTLTRKGGNISRGKRSKKEEVVLPWGRREKLEAGCAHGSRKEEEKAVTRSFYSRRWQEKAFGIQSSDEVGGCDTGGPSLPRSLPSSKPADPLCLPKKRCS